MLPILARYGPFFLSGYFVALAVGAICGLAVTAYFARRLGLANWIDGVLLGSVGALIAGRIFFVLLNQEYFRENPGEAWTIWHGGLNFQAALLGGLIAYLIWLRAGHLAQGPYLDLMAPGLAIFVSAAWMGNWLEGSAYGQVAKPGLLTAVLPDDYGVRAMRYQTQLAGLVLSLLIAGIAGWRLGRRERKDGLSGRLFWLTLAALLTVHALTALFRGDPAAVLFGWRVDLVVDLLLIGCCLIAALGARPPRQPTPDR